MPEERYEFIRAIVSEGNLSCEYRLVGNSVTGRQSHDEDVSNWTEEEIRQLVCEMLDVADDERSVIEIRYA